MSNQINDRDFFEAVILIYKRALMTGFSNKDDQSRVESEICRLFRTNAFNMSERYRAHEKMLKQFTFLKEDKNTKLDNSKDTS